MRQLFRGCCCANEAVAEVAEMVEAVEAVAGMVGGGAVPGGGDTCRPCETWRDGSWAVRAPLVML